jgi:hypothetical protein
VKSGYARQEMIEQLREALRTGGAGAASGPGRTQGNPPASRAPEARGERPPFCPKCGVPMVLRTAQRGQQAGEKFYGCPNYPRCREIRNL